jgi:hypothetical protein
MRFGRRRETIELPLSLLMAALRHERLDGVREGARAAGGDLDVRLRAVEQRLAELPTALGAMRLVGDAHALARQAHAELALREDPELLVAAAAELAAGQLLTTTREATP